MELIPEQFDPYVENLSYLTEPPYLYYWSAALALLILLWIIRSYRQNHRPIVPFKSQGGSIEIAPKTLRGIIQQTVKSVDGVEKVHCRHYVRSRGLRVKIGIHLHASARLKEVESEIKNQIRSVLWEQFGMERIEPIDIKVTRLIGDHDSPPRPAESTDPESTPEPVREHEGDHETESTGEPFKESKTP